MYIKAVMRFKKLCYTKCRYESLCIICVCSFLVCLQHSVHIVMLCKCAQQRVAHLRTVVSFICVSAAWWKVGRHKWSTAFEFWKKVTRRPPHFKNSKRTPLFVTWFKYWLRSCSFRPSSFGRHSVDSFAVCHRPWISKYSMLERQASS